MNETAAAIETAAKALPAIECRLNEPMKNHTSFKIGGPVSAMFLPKNSEELTALCETLRSFGTQPFIMGNGTNLLVNDRVIDMIVIKTSGMGGLSISSGDITADCGVPLSRLAVFACEHGLTGFEFAHGIPGTLGGAVMMNAGAYGGEIKDVVIETKTLGVDNSIFTVTSTEHDFSYRHSRYSESGEIVLTSVVRLQRGVREDIKTKMEQLAIRRRESQPLSLPSAGSTFKRPKDGYAAQLIDDAGLKGFTRGGAQVSEKHAGFVVNRGGALFSDVIEVIEHVQETVFNKSGIKLEPEIKIIR